MNTIHLLVHRFLVSETVSENRCVQNQIANNFFAVGGRALLPEVINSLQSFTYINTTVKIAHLQIAYKPFLSIFNMTNMVAARNPTFPYPEAFVDYASVITLEVRKNMAGTGHDGKISFSS